MLRKKLTWALVAETPVPSGARGVVLAMNDRDPEKLRQALLDCPVPGQIRLSWIQSQKQHGARCDLPMAALMMDWAAALPILHAAGLQPALHHLEYATQKKRASGVKHLLNLGVAVNGTRGAPPLRLLPVDDVRPDKHADQVRIARHYANAGVDPWALCPSKGTRMHTLAEEMLQQGHLKSVEVLLAGQDAASLPEALQRHPEKLWKCLEEGCAVYLTHTTSTTLGGASMAILSLCEQVKRLAGDPSDAVANDLWRKAAEAYLKKPVPARLWHLHHWAKGLMDLVPDHHALSRELQDFFQGHMQALPAELASHWEHLALQQTTANPSTARDRRVRL